MMKPVFRGGKNIALKVPAHQFEATVRFYEDVLGLERIEKRTPCFAFGHNQLWIDREQGISQAELWLEVVTDDLSAAERHLADAAVVRCDAIEKLPDGFPGFWISSPANIIHLMTTQEG